MIDGAGRVAATTHAGNEHVGIVTSDLFLQLPFDFLTDDALHLGNDVGIRVWSHRRANEIERVIGVAAPVADGGRAGITECHIACGDGMHLGTQHLHALHIGMLTLHVGLAHEDLALHIEQRTHRGSSHTMLSGACLGNDTCLAHLAGQQNLADGVVDLMGSGMIKVLSFEIEPDNHSARSYAWRNKVVTGGLHSP